MKIIKSFLLFAIGLSATHVLHAQELKAIVAPAAAAPKMLKADDRPSPAPVFTPQPAGTVTAPAAAASTATPSPFKKEESVKPGSKLKAQAAAPVTDVQPAVVQTQMQPAHLRQQNN